MYYLYLFTLTMTIDKLTLPLCLSSHGHLPTEDFRVSQAKLPAFSHSESFHTVQSQSHQSSKASWQHWYHDNADTIPSACKHSPSPLSSAHEFTNKPRATLWAIKEQQQFWDASWWRQNERVSLFKLNSLGPSAFAGELIWHMAIGWIYLRKSLCPWLIDQSSSPCLLCTFCNGWLRKEAMQVHLKKP